MKNYLIDATVLKILLALEDDDALEAYNQHLALIEKLIGTTIEKSQQTNPNLSKEELTKIVEENVNLINKAFYDKYYDSLDVEAKTVLDQYLADYAKLHSDLADYIEKLYNAIKEAPAAEVPAVAAAATEAIPPIEAPEFVPPVAQPEVAAEPAAPMAPDMPVLPNGTQVNLGGIKGPAPAAPAAPTGNPV